MPLDPNYSCNFSFTKYIDAEDRLDLNKIGFWAETNHDELNSIVYTITIMKIG